MSGTRKGAHVARGRQLLWLSLLSAVPVMALYLPMLLRQSGQYDYRMHVGAAMQLVENWAVSGPHMLFHALTAALAKACGLETMTAAMAVLAVCVAGCAALLYSLWCSDLELPTWVRLGLPTLLLVAAPISGFYPVDGHLYFGYVGVNVYHNPTILVVKPLALAIFWLTGIHWLERYSPRPSWLWWGLPLLIVLSALAKPSFLLIYLPAACLCAVLFRLAGRPVDWPLLAGAIILPGVMILGWQYWFTYSAEQAQGLYAGKSGIAFAPFKVMAFRSQWLLPKLFLSLAFPLAVTLTSPASVRRDARLLLAWLMCAAGLLLTYLFMETGPRAIQGNFAWSGQLGLFMLMVASAAHLFAADGRLWPERLREPRYLLCTALFLLHVLSGLFFYAAEYVGPERYW